jgi:MFS family permease
VIIFSLILSSLRALGMGFAPSLEVFIAVVAIVGTLSSIGHPAHEAVVADLLPPDKRAEGYGIIRVVFNTAVIIAPPIAGLLIANSYLTLFLVDAGLFDCATLSSARCLRRNRRLTPIPNLKR